MSNSIIAQPQLTDYRLPDGRIVRVEASAAKEAPVIDFTLEDGRLVPAVRADLPVPSDAGRHAWRDATGKGGR